MAAEPRPAATWALLRTQDARAPPTYARALLEAMREKGYQGTEQDLGYLLKTAFRAHPAVKKAKRGKKGVRWEGLAAAETRRTPG